MGTGKSVLGRAAAERLGFRFFDTDEMGEAADGRPIHRIFQESGEDYFRDLESAAVKEASACRGAVIATGGGALGRPENVAALKSTGVLICLAARPEVILQRVSSHGVERPLLKCSDPLARIQALLEERRSAYAQADAVVDTSDLTPSQALECVIHEWRRALERLPETADGGA